ncbi:Fic family protein [Puteibacter caeruleilacunae]|nr:Fic family protein [Puteibacter caeruleilacunae]
MNRGIPSYYIEQTIKESYKSFVPALINRGFEWKDKQINILLEQAMKELGELNAYNYLVDQASDLTRLIVGREVVASNLMEGVASRYSDVFMEKANVPNEEQGQWLDTHNYIKAIYWAKEELATRRLSLKMIKQTHQILYSDTPFEQQFAGKIRSGNFVFTSKEQSSSFVAPDKNELKRLINDAKRFWNNEDLELPNLIKMAISLYQFENILPFVDGNGRTARTLLLLELMSLKYLEYPSLSLSVIFYRNRLEYYNRLNLVRTKYDIEQWIRFFLSAIKESAIENKYLMSKALELQGYYSKRVAGCMSAKRQVQVNKILTQLYNKPFTSVKEVADLLDITFQAANVLVHEMEKCEVIKVRSDSKRNRIFYLCDYYNLFKL